MMLLGSPSQAPSLLILPLSILMSENSTPESRTEMPTGRRIGKLRDEGSLFVSMETVQVVSLIAGFLTLTILTPHIIQDMKVTLVYAFKQIASRDALTLNEAKALFVKLISMVAPHISIVMVVTATVATITVMLQTDWNVKKKKIDFKFSMLNPLAGIGRIFSVSGFINVLKSIVKLSVIIPIAYSGMKALAPEFPMLMHQGVPALMSFTGKAINMLFWKIITILAVIAAIDFVWGKFRWLKSQMMTKEEVKDEHKATEGDEETKRKIQQKGLQRIMQRIKQAVPTADVVVTNPTHYAVAIKYDRTAGGAPRVVAKGKNFLAERIKAVARENNVPVLERKPLARALYASTEVGSEIPSELFRAVAEVLAYVYRVKGIKTTRTQQPTQEARTSI